MCTRPNIADIAGATSPSWEEKLSSLVILGEGGRTTFVGKTLKMFIVSISPQFFVLFYIAVSGPTEHCPIFHFPSSVRSSVTGVPYQLFLII